MHMNFIQDMHLKMYILPAAIVRNFEKIGGMAREMR